MWLLVLVLVLLLLVTPYGYYRRADYGPYPGHLGLVLVVVLLVLIFSGWRP